MIWLNDGMQYVLTKKDVLTVVSVASKIEAFVLFDAIYNPGHFFNILLVDRGEFCICSVK